MLLCFMNRSQGKWRAEERIPPLQQAEAGHLHGTSYVR